MWKSKNFLNINSRNNILTWYANERNARFAIIAASIHEAYLIRSAGAGFARMSDISCICGDRNVVKHCSKACISAPKGANSSNPFTKITMDHLPSPTKCQRGDPEIEY
ncbi:hypothetical protein TNCV_806071 [Trichonephila clavipes]|nr:hypothetical protein TNCV_806071 [Trichonephila clavipes]